VPFKPAPVPDLAPLPPILQAPPMPTPTLLIEPAEILPGPEPVELVRDAVSLPVPAEPPLVAALVPPEPEAAAPAKAVSEPPAVAGSVLANLKQRESSRGLGGLIRSLPQRVFRQPRFMPADVCQASPAQVRTVLLLAALLAGAVVLSLVPVMWLGHLNPQTAPAWSRAVMLLAAVQIVFVVWMVNAPDWATLWVVMLVSALVATAYAVAMAAAFATPVNQSLILGMGEVRRGATGWCACVLAVMSAATYLCGRASVRWRRSTS
jgi:hypothetical protein